MHQQSISINQMLESILSSHGITFTHNDSRYSFIYELNSIFKSLHFDLIITKNNFHLYVQAPLEYNPQELPLLKFINFLNQNFIYANFAYSIEYAALTYSVSVPFPNPESFSKRTTALLSFSLLYFDILADLFIGVSNGSILAEEASIISSIRLKNICHDTPAPINT